MKQQAGTLAELQSQNASLTRRLSDMENERRRWADERDTLLQKIEEERAARKVCVINHYFVCLGVQGRALKIHLLQKIEEHAARKVTFLFCFFECLLLLISLKGQSLFCAYINS